MSHKEPKNEHSDKNDGNAVHGGSSRAKRGETTSSNHSHSRNSRNRATSGHPNQTSKSDGRHLVSHKRKAELLDKRHNLYLGTKLQPIWECRSLKINPVAADDLNRFLSNRQHTQRWSWLQQCLYIISTNCKRVPYLWSIVMILIKLVAPTLFARGTSKIAWYGTGSITLVSMFVSLFLDILEAGKRFVVGRCIDEKQCLILDGRKARLKAVRTSELVVGNIIKLSCDEEVPADIVVLACTNPDGQLHVDTSFLDGRNNLKVKHCVKDTRIESSLHSLSAVRGQIVCDKPSPTLNTFSGTLKLKGHPRPSTIQSTNFVLRGSIIRNVTAVYGVVTYAGPDTKAAQNVKNIKKPLKFGTLDKNVNRFCLVLLALYLLCVFISVGTRWSTLLLQEPDRDSKRKDSGSGELVNPLLAGSGNATTSEPEEPTATDSLLFAAVRFVILYAGLMPTTLPAIVDLLRFLHSALYDGEYIQDAYRVNQDDRQFPLIHSSPYSTHSHPVAWSLNPNLYEELGLIDFVFTDKTGTMTTGNLSASLMMVGKKSYRIGYDSAKLQEDVEADLQGNKGLDLFLKLLCICNDCNPISQLPHWETIATQAPVSMKSSSGYMHSQSGETGNTFESQQSDEVFARLKSKIQFGGVSFIEPEDEDDNDNDNAIDGDKVIDTDDKMASGRKRHRDLSDLASPRFTDLSCGDEDIFHEISSSRVARDALLFKSASREDECMSQVANDLGYRLINKTKSHVEFDARGSIENWTIVGINNFTHSRRRMSIVFRTDANDRGSILFIKGSGEALLDLISPENSEVDITLLKSRLARLGYAGFRVFVCAYKELSPQETSLYQRHYLDAEESIYTQEERFEATANIVEKHLTYLGLVAFRDEIQDGVPETLDLLMDAGVRIWMTTGDSKDMAIQTAYSSKLLAHPCRIFDSKLPKRIPPDTVAKYATSLYDLFLQERSDRSMAEQMCLVLDGTDLTTFMSNTDLQTCFLNMACLSDVVLAANLIPNQKSELVQLVKTRLLPTPITLAIGDGLNDIKMLQEAHVGVAVLGRDSPHAAAYADFAVSKFSALRVLLFLQGNRALQAFSMVLYWSFFKCLCLTLPLFYYQGSTTWLGIDLYGSFIQILFHLIFTAIPLTFCTLFEKQLPDSALTGVPLLYTLCRRRLHVNLLRLCFWVIEGIIGSTFSYFTLQTLTEVSPIYFGGGTLSARAFGLLNSLAALVISNVRLLVDSGFKTRFAWVCMTLLFVFAFPPLFLSLTYSLGGRALRAATLQVMVWHPLYFMLPLWATAAILSFAVSSFLQALLVPNIVNCIKYWIPKQTCTCENVDNFGSDADKEYPTRKYNKSLPSTQSRSFTKCFDKNNDVDAANEGQIISLRGNDSPSCQLPQWKRICTCLLERIRNEFDPSNSDWLSRLIPAPRPFSIRDAVVTDGSHGHKNIKSNHNTEEVNSYADEAGGYGYRVGSLIDRFTLRFKDMQLEADYLLDKRKNHYYANCVWYRLVFISLALFYFAGWFVEYMLKCSLHMNIDWFLLAPSMVVVTVAILCTILTFNMAFFVRYVDFVMGSLIIVMVTQHFFNKRNVDAVSLLHPVMFPIVTFVILHINFVYALGCNIIFCIISMKNIGNAWHAIPLFVGINVFVGFVGYRLEYNSRKSFLLEFSVANARKKQSELLNTMLPNFVVAKMINAKLNEDGIPIGFDAEEFQNVSIVFCDVFNFQQLVANLEPTRLVELLDSLFLAFDRCTEQFGATKIETVSETYLSALGFSRGAETCPFESASNAIDMALAMLEVANQIRYPSIIEGIETMEPLKVKIGINSGRVLSGLVGAKKPQYALFGDTVNTASRMKATGEVGHIHISASTYELVKNDSTLTFEKRETFVKGKGKLTTYMLQGALGNMYPNYDEAATTTMTGATTMVGDERLNTLRFGGLGQESDDQKMLVEQTAHGTEAPLLFECIEKDHPLNRPIPGASQTSSIDPVSVATDPCGYTFEESASFTPCRSSSSFSSNTTGVVQKASSSSFVSTEYITHGGISMASFSANDFERIRIRKLRISAAVGVLTEDDVLIREHPVLMRGYTSCAVNASGEGTRSSSVSLTRCLSLCKRKSVTNLRTSVSLVSASNSSSIGPRPTRSKSTSVIEDHAPQKSDSGELHMRRIEWLLLRFGDKLQEDRYRLHFYNNNESSHTIEHAMVIFLLTFVAQSILALVIPRKFQPPGSQVDTLRLNFIPYWTVRSVFVILGFILWLVFHYSTPSIRKESSSTRWMRFFLNLFFVSSACVFALSNSWAVRRAGTTNLWLPSDSVEFYFYIAVLHHNSAMLFQTCILVDLLLLVMSITFISSSVTRTPTTIVTLFSIPCYILFNLLSAHCRESIDRRTFYANEKARMIEDRVGQMLNEMLPKCVLQEFQTDSLRMSYCHEKMAFLFSDIVGFTSWANSVDASEVLPLLQKLFARFDRNTTKFSLYKLCTIGDAYVAVSEPAIEPPSDAAALTSIDSLLQMAYSMLHSIQEVRETFNIPGLNMRIGLHFGSCVGGVVGSGRLRYDLWGIDIYTANLMESNGVPGRICISQRLRDILLSNYPNRFTFEYNCQVKVVEGVVVDSYILTGDANNQ